MSARAIDVFCHCLPPAFCAAARRLVQGATARAPYMFERAMAVPAMVDRDARRRIMDLFPGYTQILSLASPTIEALAPPEQAPDLARVGNDALAEWVERDPDRYVGFIASLPMNNPDAACREVERAIHELGAAGVQIYTSVNGQPLDRPEYLVVIEHSAALGRPIWLHPIRPMTAADYAGEPVSKYDLWWALGWPHETSLSMARLVFAGLFDRWPDLAIVTHHVGGTIPMLAGRFDAGMDLMGTRNPPEHAGAVETALKEKPLAALKRFFADTASFGAKATIECGLAFFGPEKLLFGTDMPFDPEGGPGFIRDTLRALEAMPLSDTDRTAILSGNCERLLDRGRRHGQG